MLSKKVKYIFPTHIGTGNKGCEGITKGIIKIFGLPADSTYLFISSTYDLNMDKKIGLNTYGHLIKDYSFVNTLKYYLIRIFQKMKLLSNHILPKNYLSFLKHVDANSVVFFTGGDLYCYEGWGEKLNDMALHSKKKGAKTILLGCSIEKKLLTPAIIDGMKNYDIITARESISYETLTDSHLSNVMLFPDTAFILDPIKCTLPNLFTGNEIVGLNISSYTNNNSLDVDTCFFRNLENLLDYILESTTLCICLIPHVFWSDQDDRTISHLLMNKYLNCNRIFTLDSESLSYLQIRYIISKCRYFIGARTHSVISAYSTKVPTIALGYSVKSAGIANDLNLPEYSVINTKKISNDYKILNAFKQLEIDEKVIQENLNVRIPLVVEQIYSMKTILNTTL